MNDDTKKLTDIFRHVFLLPSQDDKRHLSKEQTPVSVVLRRPPGGGSGVDLPGHQQELSGVVARTQRLEMTT